MSQEANIVLSVEGVTKAYDSVPALDGITFQLRQGEALGVIGPSGSGKSTLLKAIDLLVPIQSGTITYFGATRIAVQGAQIEVWRGAQIVSNRSIIFQEIRQQLGFVFQHLNLWEDVTVLENLTLAPKVVLKESAIQAKERAIELCDRFGLAERLQSRVWQLSGGQKQRVAIMRALMMRPRLLLLDEVTSALDPVLVVDVMEAIRSLRKEGIAFILVTHHVEFACSLCDRIMFLQDGKVVQLGDPAELKRESADPRVRDFLRLVRTAA